MGQAICSIAEDHGCRITHPVDLGDDPAEFISDSDLVIDFSLRDATRPLAELALENDKPIVIGTTGHDMDDRKAIEKIASEIPMVWAGNFSTGVNLLFYLTQQAARVLDARTGFDPEVIEMHHRLKQDAPVAPRTACSKSLRIRENSVKTMFRTEDPGWSENERMRKSVLMPCAEARRGR